VRHGSTSAVIGLGISWRGPVTGAGRPGPSVERTQHWNAGEGAGTKRVAGRNAGVLWLRMTCRFSLAPGP
jgi:hypothetical protein